MKLIEIQHHNQSSDIWNIINVDVDWGEEECRAHIAAEAKKRAIVAVPNESGPPDYYVTDKSFPNWEDNSWYDYSQCGCRDEPDATCAEGCENCPYDAAACHLQMKQQLEWIRKECRLLPL